MKKLLRVGLLTSTFCALVLLPGASITFAADCNNLESFLSEGIPYQCENVKLDKTVYHKTRHADMASMLDEGIPYDHEQAPIVISRKANNFSGGIYDEGIIFKETVNKNQMKQGIKPAHEQNGMMQISHVKH